ncbi:MAG: ribose-phosphate pyrophosphokinase [Candidatus Caenarcaniphilales bacterium]|nr:ribose-phosphate pyrophosphokinase [Candidatus Caenarcaniphilales bacterium]
MEASETTTPPIVELETTKFHWSAPEVKLFSGRANKPLSEEIAACLGTTLGEMTIKPFSDGELYIKVMESVRGDDVFLIQPTCPPVNENLMELLIMIDALKRASAERITVLIPYFGYARQDRKATGREPITAKLVANLLAVAGAHRIVALDLHATQIMGFFDTLVDHLFASPVLASYLQTLNLNNPVIVSPDVGGVARARAFAKRMHEAPLAIVDKRRSAIKMNSVEVFNIIGEVKDRDCVLLDDIIDTGGTICKAAGLLKEKGAIRVYACATHAVLSGPGVQNVQESSLQELIVTNSIHLPEEKCIPKIRQLSVAPLLAEVICRIHNGDTVSSMFE